VKQREVHPPAIDPHPTDASRARRNVSGDSGLDLRPESQRVPMEMTHDTDGLVVEPMDLAQSKVVAVPGGGEHPAIRGPQVDGQVVRHATHSDPHGSLNASGPALAVRSTTAVEGAKRRARAEVGTLGVGRPEHGPCARTEYLFGRDVVHA